MVDESLHIYHLYDGGIKPLAVLPVVVALLTIWYVYYALRKFVQFKVRLDMRVLPSR